MHLGVWFDRKLRGNVHLVKMGNKARRVVWKSDMHVQSEWTDKS